MSRRRTFGQNLLDLSIERRIIGIASVVTLIACFLPWYGSNSRLAINQVLWNAFDSIGSVGGYLIAVFSLLSLVMIITPVVKENVSLANLLPWSESALLLFFSAQSAFVAMIFIPVYAQYALVQSSNSGTRFGIYVALASSLAAAITALLVYQKENKDEVSPSSLAELRSHRSLDEAEEESHTSPLEEGQGYGSYEVEEGGDYEEATVEEVADTPVYQENPFEDGVEQGHPRDIVRDNSTHYSDRLYSDRS